MRTSACWPKSSSANGRSAVSNALGLLATANGLVEVSPQTTLVAGSTMPVMR